MKSMLMFFAPFAIMLVLAGCASTEPKSTSGVVSFSKDYSSAGEGAVDIPFVSISGQQTSLRGVSQPIVIVAFVNSPGNACSRLVPELVGLASRLRNEQITVVQISLPTSKCPHGPGCTETCHIDDVRLISLCDPERVAWKAYNQPKPNTVFLIDDHNRIVDTKSIGDIDTIAHRAKELANKLREID